jgi:hypothetical protein
VEGYLRDQTAPLATPKSSWCVKPASHFPFLSSQQFLDFSGFGGPWIGVRNFSSSAGGVDFSLLGGGSSSPFSRFRGVFEVSETGERMVLRELIFRRKKERKSGDS